MPKPQETEKPDRTEPHTRNEARVQTPHQRFRSKELFRAALPSQEFFPSAIYEAEFQILLHQRPLLAPITEETKEEPAKEGTEEAAEAPAEAAEESKEPEETESKENEEKPAHKEGREEAPFNAEEQEQTAEEAKKFLENVFKGMHLNVTMEKMMNEDRILLSLHGEGLGILIGKHGQTLDALQYLTNLAAGKSFRHHYFVMLDVENYRERRQDTLEALAHRLAGKARRTGEPVKLEPMPAGERRIIHLALQDDPSVSTESEGEAPYRYVVISPNR